MSSPKQVIIGDFNEILKEAFNAGWEARANSGSPEVAFDEWRAGIEIQTGEMGDE
jgi:hypothetical protein